MIPESHSAYGDASTTRPRRGDAERNASAVLEAAKAVFVTDGVDAPAKLIGDRAGVGVGTVDRHFPRRSDLVKAVYTDAVDACVAEAAPLAAAHPPFIALREFVRRYTGFIATKHGLGAALHSGDPAFDELAGYFIAQFEPALAELLESAAAAGEIRSDASARDLLFAVARLCSPRGGGDVAFSQRMVSLLIDGLRVDGGH